MQSRSSHPTSNPSTWWKEFNRISRVKHLCLCTHRQQNLHLAKISPPHLHYWRKPNHHHDESHSPSPQGLNLNPIDVNIVEPTAPGIMARKIQALPACSSHTDLVSKCIEQTIIVRTLRLKAAVCPLSRKECSDLKVAASTRSGLRTKFFTLHHEYKDHFPEPYTATTAPELAQAAGAAGVPQPTSEQVK